MVKPVNLKKILRGGGVRLDLSGFNFERQDLNGIFLHKCNLKNSVWDGANLENADFSGSDLRGAKLRKTKMRGTSLRGAAIDGARFAGADITHGCDVFGANLGEPCNLELTHLKNLSAAISPKFKPVVVKDAEISKIFGNKNAAIFHQNGEKWLTIGTTATLPLKKFQNITKTELNAISQKCLEAEQWDSQKRIGWAAKAWDIWTKYKGELLNTAENPGNAV